MSMNEESIYKWILAWILFSCLLDVPVFVVLLVLLYPDLSLPGYVTVEYTLSLSLKLQCGVFHEQWAGVNMLFPVCMHCTTNDGQG